MADEEMIETESSGGMGILGFVAATAAAAVTSVVDFVAGDRALMGALRQGVDELGTALQPLPDSIQVDESGTLWNPTPGEIAAAAHIDTHWSYEGHPTPGEIAASQQPYVAEQDHGQDLGNDMSY
jgi:hypothetical protein